MGFSLYGKAFRKRPAYLIETLRIMRLTGIFMLAGCIQVSAHGYGQGKVSLAEKDATLEKVFKDIQKQTNYYFLYHEDILSDSKKVSLEVHEMSLEDVLRLCFKDQPLTYSIVSNSIVVQARVSEGSIPIYAVPTADGHDVSGKVTDEDGNPLPLATVTIKGTKKSISTNERGEFVLKNVDLNATLVISSVGYEEYVISTKGETVLTIGLKKKTGQLDETVIKGYYSTTNRLNTGDVTTIKGEEIQEQPVTDPLLALEGRVPGLYVQQASGIPGAYSTVRIMGQNSIANGNDPLYIVDGVPFSSTSLTSTAFGGGAVGDPTNSAGLGVAMGLSPFNSLNPSDIESIEVLKDADATAIYGSRGANGVILITTKKGKPGATRVDINVFSGSGKVTRMMDLLNTPAYLEMRHEALDNDGISPSIANGDFDLLFWDTTHYTNWQKTLIGNAAQLTSAQGSISGGNENTQFVIGGGFTRQGTTYPGNYFDQKGSAHINLTHSTSDHRLHAQFTATYVNDNSNLPTSDFANSILLAPDAPALHSNTNLNWAILNGRSTWNNPLALTLRSASAITNNLVSNLNLSYMILPGLQVKSSFGFTHDEMNQSLISPASAAPPPNNTNPAYRSNNFGTSYFETWIIEPQVNYQKNIAKGKFELLAGVTFQQNAQNSLSQSASGFATDALISDPLAASTSTLLSKINILYHYDALFGRINYNWQDKYLVNITARRDGSSRFGPGNQFGNFGAAGGGWIFSRERLIKNSFPFLSFGKLRGSYGITGNDQITDYQYLSTYSSLSSTYQGSTALYPTRISNPYFGWEVVKKLEGGLDLGFLNDRILVSATYYRNRTGNQLVGYSLPAVTGFNTIVDNLPAIVQNTGEEFVLTTINIRNSNFTWTSSLNLTIPKNKLVAYPNLATSSYKNKYVIGKSLFLQNLFHYIGVNDSTGVYEYATGKGEQPDNPSYPQDLQANKQITETLFGGFRNSFKYKSFQIDILLQFVKQTGYNFINSIYSPGQFNQNVPTYFLRRWQKPGETTNVGQFSTQNNDDPNYDLQTSDYVISDASFIRLKNLSLSYSLPAGWQRKAHLQNARVYIQGQNLLTITKYMGLDPENAGFSGGFMLPPLRMVTAGFQITL